MIMVHASWLHGPDHGASVMAGPGWCMSHSQLYYVNANPGIGWSNFVTVNALHIQYRFSVFTAMH